MPNGQHARDGFLPQQTTKRHAMKRMSRGWTASRPALIEVEFVGYRSHFTKFRGIEIRNHLRGLASAREFHASRGDSRYRQSTPIPIRLQPAKCCAMLQSLVRRNTFRNRCRMAQIRIIKKYPNRRLYDTEISSYITLEDVRQLIVDNESFEVRDAKTGDDLTRSVLLQIITEHEDDGQPMLSTELLSQIIRFYGDSLQGFMGSYLERSMQMFLEQQTQFRSQLNSLIGQTPWSMLNQLTERNMDLWKSFQQGLLGTMGNAADESKPGNGHKSRAR
jgi:polyhydroxyalkanoate synthesis repressor PhaR